MTALAYSILSNN